MRAAAVLFALVVTPFVAGVAQGTNPFSDPKNCGVHLSYSVRAGTRRPDAALVHGGKHGVMDRPCASDTPPTPVVQPPADTTVVPPPVVEPPLPACAVTDQLSLGPWSVDGQVRDWADYTNVLAKWCMHLTGPGWSVTMRTGDDGRYKFTGLPDGAYSVTVCQDLQDPWVAYFPDPSSNCQTFDMAGWYSVSYVDFRNIIP